MSRWYQNVLTGEQVEVTTFKDDDFYVKNRSNWSRIDAPLGAAPDVASVGEPVAKSAGVVVAKKKQGR